MVFAPPSPLPQSLQSLVEHHLTQWQTAAAQEEAGQPETLGEEFTAELAHVLAGSDFVAEQLRRDPAMAWRLTADGLLWRSLGKDEMQTLLEQALAGVDSEDRLSQVLRRFRQEQQVRIIWPIAGCMPTAAQPRARQ